MILFYSEKLTPRIRYISRLMLEELLGLSLRFTNDKEEYLQSKIPKINYSREPIQSGIYIQAANLLFETDIFEQDFKSSNFEGYPVFFLSNKKSHLPFDPFAASFYLVSRYEEYIPFIADEHNRFPAEESVLFKLKSLDKPLVNIYARQLGKVIKDANPKINFKYPEYRFINTIDIDNASAYLGKGILRTLASYVRDLLRFEFSEIWQRSRTIFGLQRDPFETLPYLLNLQEKHGFKSIYFVLFSRLSQYDRNLTRYSTRLQHYVKDIADYCEVGVHPSYRSNHEIKVLEEELLSLERVIKKDVTKSRQHFLILNFPITYRRLLELEIEDDYSMGYSDRPGFRAGICTSFRFYDLEQEIETPLRVHPFPFMDGAFMYGLKIGPEESWPIIQEYIKIYREFGGEFIPLWHNRIFSEKEEEWKGWNQIYERMLKAAI